MSQLAPYLNEAQILRALAITWSLDDEPCRARGLGGLITRLDQRAQDTAAAEISRVCLSYPDSYIASLGLTPALPYLNVAQVTGLVLNTSGSDEYMRAGRIAEAGAKLPADVMSIALEAVDAIPSQNPRAYGLAALAPALPDALRHQVIEALVAMSGQTKDLFSWATHVCRLARYLTAFQQQRTLQIIAASGSPLTMRHGITGLAPHLDAAGRDAATEIARTIEDDDARLVCYDALHLAATQAQAP